MLLKEIENLLNTGNIIKYKKFYCNYKAMSEITYINETDKMQKIDVKKYIPDLYKHLEKLTNA